MLPILLVGRTLCISTMYVNVIEQSRELVATWCAPHRMVPELAQALHKVLTRCNNCIKINYEGSLIAENISLVSPYNICGYCFVLGSYQLQ